MGFIPFAAFDGEGINVECPLPCSECGCSETTHSNRCNGKHHEYVLLAVSYRSGPSHLNSIESHNIDTRLPGTDIYNSTGLSYEECIRFIYNHGLNRVNIGFAIGYDINMMFKRAPNDIIQSLFKEGKDTVVLEGLDGEVEYRYKARYLPRKILLIKKQELRSHNKKGDKKWKTVGKVTLCDAWGFYQASFEKALQDWGFPHNVEETQLITLIAEGKKNRDVFAKWKPSDITLYNEAELRMLIPLMEAFQEKLDTVSIVLSSYHGAGAIANFFLTQWNAANYRLGGNATIKRDASGHKLYVKNKKGKPTVEIEIIDTSGQRTNVQMQEDLSFQRRNAYFGGRIELCKRTVQDPPMENVHHYDINCLDENTIIDTEFGTRFIKDIKKGDFVFNDKYLQQVGEIKDNGIKSVYRIDLEDGSCIEATANHRFPVFSKRSKRQDKYVKDLQKGDLLKIKKWKYKYEFDDFAALMGIWLAEGGKFTINKAVEWHDKSRGKLHRTRHNNFRFCVDDREIKLINFILSTVHKYLPNATIRMARKQQTHGVDIRISDKSSVLEFKRLYDNFMNHEPSFTEARSFLQGFFEGDGCYNIARNEVSVCQAKINDWKLNMVKHMLEVVDVPYHDSGWLTFKSHHNKEGFKIVRWLTIRPTYMTIFQNKVGFLTYRRKGLFYANKYQNRLYSRIIQIEYVGEKHVYDIQMSSIVRGKANKTYPYFWANNILSHNSAYPFGMLSIPAIKKEWHYYSTTQISSDYHELVEGGISSNWMKNRQRLMFGLVKVRWDEPERTLGPFPYREENGYVIFPNKGTGTYHIIEVLTAIMKGYNSITILEAWVMEKPYIYPFAEQVDAMAKKRLEYKKKKDGAHKPLKLGLNAFYGKFASKPTDTQPHPRYRDLFWAGYLTAQARSLMLWHCVEDELILFATDGIYSNVPLSCPISENLGEFEYEFHDRGIFLLAGIYAVTYECDGKECDKHGCHIWKDKKLHWENKERGYTDLVVTDVKDYLMKELAEHPDELPDLAVDDDRFIGNKLGMTNYKAMRRCEWATIHRKIDPSNNHKRSFSCDSISLPRDEFLTPYSLSAPYNDKVKTHELEDDENIEEFAGE